MSLLPDTFTTRRVSAGALQINCAVGGEGPPVLLLHGYPETHVMWHRVLPALARTHTVVLADLRGYGDSDKPAPSADAAEYAKRAMAADQVALMRTLGHERFALVGHDRGARVGLRLAFDHPAAVTRFAALDIVPTRALPTRRRSPPPARTTARAPGSTWSTTRRPRGRDSG